MVEVAAGGAEAFGIEAEVPSAGTETQTWAAQFESCLGFDLNAARQRAKK